jgi:hypothetical protein
LSESEKDSFWFFSLLFSLFSEFSFLVFPLGGLVGVGGAQHDAAVFLAVDVTALKFEKVNCSAIDILSNHHGLNIINSSLIRINQLPISATSLQHRRKICFETFIMTKITKLLKTQKPLNLKKK